MNHELEHCYRVLGLSSSASPRELRRAYRNLVRSWHPDLFTHNPREQAVAQERLKEINAAYHLIQEHLAAAGPAPVEPPPTAPPAPPPRPQAPPHRAPSPPRAAPPPSVPAVNIFPFFTAWENGLFLLLVAAVCYFVNARYPSLAAGAGHALRLLIVPLAFALLCNSRLGSHRWAWRMYVAATLVFSLWLLVDLLTFSAAVQNEAQTPGYYDSYGGGAGFRGPLADAPAPFSLPGQRSPGPMGPAAPLVPAPAAPLAPVEPAAPAAPMVAPAR
ncbi:J domain-containing protein [Geomonas sp. Red875]|uniref:J domain-containing protein n=1 Tax=Geomesophilobacter sediminis TaxID=2798584 RepID=A0A8J7M3D8_9BACT|nr:J domain-containing protein [Geomesophilobacter sediminis]